LLPERLRFGVLMTIRSTVLLGSCLVRGTTHLRRFHVVRILQGSDEVQAGTKVSTVSTTGRRPFGRGAPLEEVDVHRVELGSILI